MGTERETAISVGSSAPPPSSPSTTPLPLLSGDVAVKVSILDVDPNLSNPNCLGCLECKMLFVSECIAFSSSFSFLVYLRLLRPRHMRSSISRRTIPFPFTSWVKSLFPHLSLLNYLFLGFSSSINLLG